MGHNWKNGLHYNEKWVTPGNMGRILKNALHLEKISRTCKYGSHFEKCVTLGKMEHTRKNGSLVKMGHFFKNWSHLENWVTIEKMGQSHLKDWAPLEKWATLRKLGHTW